MAGEILPGNMGDTGGGPQETLPHPHIPPAAPGVVGVLGGRRAGPHGGGWEVSAPAKHMGRILLPLPRSAGEGGKSGGWQRHLGPRWGLSSHCPFQKICGGSKPLTAGGDEDVPIPPAPGGSGGCFGPGHPTAAPWLPYTGVAPHGFSASLNRKHKQLLGKPPPPPGVCQCLITLRAQNQPQPRLAERCIAGAANESCRAHRDACSVAQPPWKCRSPLGESCFSSRVCRCFIDAAAFLLVSADR